MSIERCGSAKIGMLLYILIFAADILVQELSPSRSGDEILSSRHLRFTLKAHKIQKQLVQPGYTST